MSDLRQQIAELSPERRALLERLLKQQALQQSPTRLLPRRADGPAPLSFDQEQLWFLAQLEPGNSAYNLSVTLRFHGELDEAALRRSLEEIVRRHEILRTIFVATDGHPLQVVRPGAELALTLTDLGDMAPGERQIRLQTLLGAEAACPFDLAAGPLLRARLYRIECQEWLLGLTVHHLVADGWSLRVLKDELAILLPAFTVGRSAPLPELAVQYADFAAWQRSEAATEATQTQLSWWQERLRGLAPLDLLGDLPRPPVRSGRGAQHSLALSVDLMEALCALARQQGATPYMVLLASFQALLGRWTGSDDVTVGSPLAHRPRHEFEKLIGFFVNTLVLRADLSGDPTFADFLGRVRETCLEAIAHQDVPFARLVAELQPHREPGRHPLFQVLFVFQNRLQNAAPSGVHLELAEVHNGTSKFDLSLYVREHDMGWTAYFEYSTDLFEPDTIHRLAGCWQTLLQGIASDPRQRLSELPLLTAAEKALLSRWNLTQAPMPPEPCLHQLVEAQAARTPDALAVSWQDQAMTYQELNRRANQLARHLRHYGIGPDAIVGISLERCPDLLVGLLGILKAGGAYLPLEPTYPVERLARMLSDARVTLVLTQEKLLERLPVNATPVVCLDRDRAALDGAVPDNLEVDVQGSNLAYVLFTSGSTGRPKGVAVEHRSVAGLVDWGRRLCSPAELAGVLASTSIGFDVSVFEMFVPLAAGGRIILADNILALPQLPAVAEVTLVSTVPSALRELLRIGPLPPSVGTVHVAGEALSHELAEEVYRQGRVKRLLNLYGPTEATVYATWALVAPRNPRGPAIGRPIANTHAYVLDAHLRQVPVGVAGELFLAGAGLARGYLHQPELTAERFLPDPFAPTNGARMYRTGDRVRWRADGNLEYLGRLDQQVKLRGFRIELGEVESALRGLGQVLEAVVMLREDSPGDPRLVGYVVPRPGHEPDAADLKKQLRLSLPEYMVPATFVFLTSLPMGPHGKLDRKSLPAPDLGDTHTGGYVAPRTPTEDLVAAIWQELLGSGPVGVRDDFFERGGHSLLATRVIARLRALLGLEIPLRLLFEAPTVAETAAWIDEQGQTGGRVVGPPLRPVVRTGSLPLSFAQQRLWFLEQWQPGSAAYNIAAAVRLRGSLDVEVLERSLQEIVDRHEALRTTFARVDDQPSQAIAPELAIQFSSVDFGYLPIWERESAWQALARAEGQRPFDLAMGPLFRLGLVRLDTANHVLLLTLHHIIGDGWSLQVILTELCTLYGALVADRPAALPALSLQYADYAAWQRDWFQGEILERQLAFWKERLHGLVPLSLPTDHPRPATQTFAGATLSFELPAELTGPLQALARQYQGTLYMVLLAAFQTLLGRWTSCEDITVGSPVANRPQRELEPLIGFFVNTLVLRTDLSGDPSFAELLGRVRQTCLLAFAHQDVPFERLVEELEPKRDPSRNPLFQVLFAWDQGIAEATRVMGLDVQAVRVDTATSKFDLSLHVAEKQGILTGYFEYSTSLFAAETIVRLARHWQTLLQGIVHDAACPISRLPLLTAEERQQTLAGFNATRRDYPGPQLLHRLVHEQAARSPDAPAVTFREETLSYAELERRANRLAHRLTRLGAAPDRPVALFMERSTELLVALLACLKAGAAYLPLEPDHPALRLTGVLDEARPPLLLCQPQLRQRLPHADIAVLCILPGGTELQNTDLPLTQEPDTTPDVDVQPDHLAYVIYTSGSTGMPKGAMNTHRGICNRLLWMQAEYCLSGRDTVLQKTPYGFDVSVWEFFWPLLAGARLVLAEPGGHKDPAYLAGLIERQRVSVLHFVPSMLRVFLQEADLESKCRTVRDVICSGEALAGELAGRFFQAMPQARLHNLYGPTEAAVDVTYWQCRPEDAGGTVPIGRPVANTQLYVLDGHMQPVPVGVAGELYIGGVQVARGYLARPELTSERFVPDPYGTTGGRLYRTGDRGRWRSDGVLEYLGRLDDQVKVRGQRIELGEIEAALLAHPDIREAAVAVREDPGGEPRLVGYVVGRAGAAPAAGELRLFLRERLPEAMVPAIVVALAALPLSANGKLDRKALPAPEPGGTNDGTLVPPRTPLEAEVATVWREVLGRDHFGVHDSFFDLGGHSLLATQVMSRLQAVFGVEISLQAFFARPTIAALAESIEAGHGRVLAAAMLPLQRRTVQEPVLSFAQQRLWFLDQWEPASPLYSIPAAMHIQGPLDLRAFEWSIQKIVERHEILRTTFRVADGNPVPVVIKALRLSLRIEDLTNQAAVEAESAAWRLIHEEARRPFDLGRGPLLRVGVYRLATDDFLVFVNFSHIVADGWSLGVFNRELSALYEAFVADKPPALPELTVQYADYAGWQRKWLQGEVLGKQLDYWREKLKALAPLDLPADYPRPMAPSYRGAHLDFRLERHMVAGVHQLARRQGGTPFMVLLAAFQALLGRTTGREDVAVGAPVANRQRPEIEPLIGCFVNMLVLRTDLAGDPSFAELVKRVRETCLAAYAHQNVPFERLVEELQPQRDGGRHPLFQVLFVLQNTPTGQVRISGLRQTTVEIDTGTSKFDLTLRLTETTDGAIAAVMEYATDLFEADTIARLAGHYITLLRGAIAEPATALSRLPLLTAEERQQALADFNATYRDYPGPQLLHRLVHEQAARSPDAPAVTFREETLSYAELERRANRLAQRLTRLGAAPDRPVALFMERSTELVVALLACLKAGAAYLPLEPDHPALRLTGVLDEARPPLLLCQPQLRQRLPHADIAVLCILPGGTELQNTDLPLTQEPDTTPDVDVQPDHLAYVIYTSGSTGMPKGAMNTHRGICNRLLWMQAEYRLCDRDTVLQKTPYGFDVSVWEFFWPLLAGARLVLAEPGGHKDPAYLAGLIERQRVSVLHFVPSMLRVFLQETQLESKCRTVREVICSGEALAGELAGRFFQALPQARLHNLYGPTEAAVDVTYWQCRPEDAGGAVPIGRPVANTQLYVLDKHMQPVPVGVAGELYIGGVQVARGYLARPELTLERFVPDPYGAMGGRLYRTGDRGRWRSDGVLEYLGRLDDQVKVRGQRIELGEIEAALLAHPDIREAAVAVREDPGGEPRLVGYVVGRAGAAPAAGELRLFLRERLPEAMVPAIVVALPALPLSANGKLDRKALPAPEPGGTNDGTLVPPRTPLEAEVATVWREVLGRDHFGVHDSFFDLGGHSLLATQVLSRLRQRFQVALPLRRLFEEPTVANLAAMIDQEPGGFQESTMDRSGMDNGGQLQADLDQLADEEVDILLQRALAEQESSR